MAFRCVEDEEDAGDDEDVGWGGDCVGWLDAAAALRLAAAGAGDAGTEDSPAARAAALSAVWGKRVCDE